MMGSNHWPTLVLLLIAAVASGVLVKRNTEGNPDRKQKPEIGIGYYMYQAELVTTGETGQVLYRMVTDKARQITVNGIIELDNVWLGYDPVSEIPWDLHADKGYIQPESNIIRLTGDVIAETREEARTPIRISTDYLELNTDTYIADTDRDVAIDHKTDTIFATGLRAYLKDEKLQLISNVNGTFIP